MDLTTALKLEKEVRAGYPLRDELAIKALLHIIDSLRPKPEADADTGLDQVIDLYHRNLPTCNKIRALNAARRAKIVKRWQEVMRSTPEAERKSLADWWRSVFEYAAQSEFLTGTRTNDRGWRPNIDFFLQPSSLAKLLEGQYHTDKRAMTAKPADGGAYYWMR